MTDLTFLQQSFENFNRATASLQQAYAQLEKKFSNINGELAVKNRELERTIAEKDEVKNYLQNILESLTNGVVVTDRAGNIQTLNRCAEVFAEVAEGQVKGRHISTLFEDISPEAWGDIFFSKYFHGEQGHKIKLQGRTLEIFGSPVKARNDEIVGAVFILRDVSRIEKLEEMAKRKEKLASMGEMAANIAHEIRNPLGSIELFATLLMKDLKEAKDRDKIAKIVASVKNVDNKISNLLLFTKTNHPRTESLEVHELLQETLMFTEPLASEGNISLTFDRYEGEAFIRGDEEMLKQVFLNIILNAFQAMPEGGELLIETRFSPVDQERPQAVPFLEILFSDSGIGIPEENLPKIFDPFFSTREGTSGLGLAIVHNIVDQHKGAIHVEKGKKKGTVFTVLLPIDKL